MARSLSLNFREAINAEESGEVAIFLLTIDHADLAEPIRLSTDPTERVTDVPLQYRTVSNGESFTYLPMQVIFPDERENAPPRAQFRICNVTRDLIEFIRSTTIPATAKLELVLASDLDSVEVESPWLDIISVNNSARDLTFDMTLNSMATEQWPTELNGSILISGLTCQVDFSSFVGLPYRDLGRGPDAYDCWGLVVAVYSAAGVELPSYAETYITAEDLKAINCLISGSLQPWREISEQEVRPLDGVLVKIAGYERHIGLVVKRGHMLHVGLDLGPSRIERYNSLYLKKRISRFMRHEALA